MMKFFDRHYVAIHIIFAVVLAYVAVVDLTLFVEALYRGDEMAAIYRGFATFFLGFAAGVSIRKVIRHRATEH